ncbi:neuroglobin-like isoform X1 [Littorina saxatilis]|uniref:neuroglobin-like isoform X1 n=1 Tax=Littorina saxatilis TaxID=31220 RepID=UPI0038B42F31
MGCVQCKGNNCKCCRQQEKAMWIRTKVEPGKNSKGPTYSETITCTVESQCSKTCKYVGIEMREIFLLKQSWEYNEIHMVETGVEMFIRLFKSNSELKNMFHEFKDLTSEDDLRANEALENHATLVMTTLDDAITHIDNYDYVSEVLRKTGASHVRFEGFKSDNFLNIRDPFLEAVKITLGDRYTDNMESIYKVAITFILQTMVEGMEDALKNKAT